MAEKLKLKGTKVSLRRARPKDARRLLEIFSTPEVVARWGEYRMRDVRKELVGGEDKDTVPLVIRFEGTIVGFIQFSEEQDPEYRHAGMDIALHPDWHGKGLGTDAIRAVARHLFEKRGHHRLTIDPAADNEVAIRAYTAVGFKPVGIMREYERIDDGPWHDGLLMDMVKGELR